MYYLPVPQKWEFCNPWEKLMRRAPTCFYNKRSVAAAWRGSIPSKCGFRCFLLIWRGMTRSREIKNWTKRVGGWSRRPDLSVHHGLLRSYEVAWLLCMHLAAPKWIFSMENHFLTIICVDLHLVRVAKPIFRVDSSRFGSAKCASGPLSLPNVVL